MVKAPKGKPKSGRTWKLEARRASAKVVRARPTFQERMSAKRADQDVKNIEKEMKAERGERLRIQREKTEAKKKRKEENDLKSGKFEVIRKTETIKKMSKKAKKSLVKISPELAQKLKK
uniref:Coiled-coil domain-containing protein 86 n=1 Tax=Chromera velia CCMP2878 TaxID=1169474 RepID=A0A0G4H896_9ALVE|mmetsp:Transcript_50899/g.100050  ORF Transcript_50899/g.100050 Transcript_50899/m.100050 type:complete len:119 (-) Transcript_50899:216-572(-)|eukprot:Cvel_5845.t1-p1 / transcript=Cvel_5845.t1 / gene=Cvel_5845 / organism=Chromera_velia_CCMP2878 / gene_product=hypothetical protein / transcript_product=hypothetical protein / location=Cvel_scaffold278:13025-13468(-) / protein_length=118 / sequence_SO=supercontig / SO=protein_coding / is_pseudo=false